MSQRPAQTPRELSTARENHVTVLLDFASGQVRSVSAEQERDMAQSMRRAQQEARVRLLSTAA